MSQLRPCKDNATSVATAHVGFVTPASAVGIPWGSLRFHGAHEKTSDASVLGVERVWGRAMRGWGLCGWGLRPRSVSGGWAGSLKASDAHQDT